MKVDEGLVVITAVVMVGYVSWDITPMCLLHASCWALVLFFNPEDGGDIFLRNVG
jgi:hypothetical protein